MRNLLVILLCTLIAACHEKHVRDLPARSIPFSSASFKRDIPHRRNGEPDILYLYKKQYVQQLNLDSLEDGYDSLEIRIWYDYAMDASKDLVIIKRNAGEWSGKYYRITFDWDTTRDIDTVKNLRIKSVQPFSGWDAFIRKLDSLKIMTLPTMDEIAGLEDRWADGVEYMVEIATKNQYRFYNYHLPEKFEKRYWQAKNMVGIILTLENEMKVYSALPPHYKSPT